MVSSMIRKAIGAVKEQPSISLAKVAGSIAPDLEVLVVKATTHDEDQTDEKYIREIINLTSYSCKYVTAAVATVSKHLSKTHNWIVALKALMLVHRVLVDGHPSFEEEIVSTSRRGLRVLNLSSFRDEAHSGSCREEEEAGLSKSHGLGRASLRTFKEASSPHESPLVPLNLVPAPIKHRTVVQSNPIPHKEVKQTPPYYITVISCTSKQKEMSELPRFLKCHKEYSYLGPGGAKNKVEWVSKTVVI